MSSNARSVQRALVVLVTVAATLWTGAATAAAADSDCTAPWGSLPATGTFAGASGQFRTRVVDVRAGRHECFDRLVVDLDEVPAGYEVEYVTESAALAMGLEAPLRGAAIVAVTVTGMDGADDRGGDGFDPADPSEAVDVGGFRTFRQVAYSGPFEDSDRAWLGVRARLPFRVFTLPGPGDGARLVVDVAHRWYTQRRLEVFFNTGDGTDCGEVTGFPRAADGVRAPIGHALARLVEGPTAIERHQGATSFFSADTAGSVRSVNLRPDGLLIVDFADIRAVIPNASTSCGSEALLSSLNATVFQFPVVDRVRYRINGSCEDFFQWLQRDCTDLGR